MDSVKEPHMIIYLRQHGRILRSFKVTCKVIDGSKMQCPTPNLYKVVEYLFGSGESTGTPENTTEQPSKVKRAAPVDNKYLNGRNGVTFTLGFIYDGYTAYKDLSKSSSPALRSLSNLYIYEDPSVKTFKDNAGSETLLFHPVEDRIIRLKGERLDYVLSEADYEVKIGEHGKCNVTSLTSNQLVCKPPARSPRVKDDNFITYNGRRIPHVEVEFGTLEVSLGYVYYESNIWNDNTAFRISMIVLMVVVGLALLGVLIYCLVKKYRIRNTVAKKHYTVEDHSARYVSHGATGEEVIIPFLGRKLDPNILASVNRCKIPMDRLVLGKQLGKGNFGLVYKGQLTTPAGNLKTVAVKSIKEDKEMTFEDMESFLTEGTLMIDFRHENVLSLVGVVYSEGERPLVVLPYMENGDLCNIIKKDDVELVLADLLHFGYQMANGMTYLSKQRFVHRDLAARNCMVDGSYILKIADFGMSRDIYEKDYYSMDSMNKPLPMKWMAVESLKEGRYTTKSDVWSFGITMWELLTRGSTPYPGVNNYYIKEYVGTGKRLDKPAACPPIIYDMMCKCWEEDPQTRPSFAEISSFIGLLLKGEVAPGPGSGEKDGYYYTRNATKDIPGDYLDVRMENISDDYITPLPDDDAPIPPSATSVSATAEKVPKPTDDPNHIYVNSEE